MSQAESRLSRKIIEHINSRGGFAFKIQAGPTVMAGLPDIIVCWRGFFIGLETKVPDAAGATKIQQHVHRKIRDVGGVVLVVRSVDEVDTALSVLDKLFTASEDAADKPTSLFEVNTAGRDPGTSQAISGDPMR